MSNASFSLSMTSMGNRPRIGGYKSWKPNYPYQQYPKSILPVNRQPLTNRDPGNIFTVPFGKPRPLKIPRKQRNFLLPTQGIPIWVANNMNHYSSINNPIVGYSQLTGITILTSALYAGGTPVTQITS